MRIIQLLKTVSYLVVISCTAVFNPTTSYAESLTAVNYADYPCSIILNTIDIRSGCNPYEYIDAPFVKKVDCTLNQVLAISNLSSKVLTHPDRFSYSPCDSPYGDYFPFVPDRRWQNKILNRKVGDDYRKCRKENDYNYWRHRKQAECQQELLGKNDPLVTIFKRRSDRQKEAKEHSLESQYPERYYFDSHTHRLMEFTPNGAEEYDPYFRNDAEKIEGENTSANWMKLFTFFLPCSGSFRTSSTDGKEYYINR